MAITDLLAVLGVFGGFGLLIFAKLNKNNPELIPRIKEWMKAKPKEIADIPKEFKQQIYHEKSRIM